METFRPASTFFSDVFGLLADGAVMMEAAKILTLAVLAMRLVFALQRTKPIVCLVETALVAADLGGRFFLVIKP